MKKQIEKSAFLRKGLEGRESGPRGARAEPPQSPAPPPLCGGGDAPNPFPFPFFNFTLLLSPFTLLRVALPYFSFMWII
jgi:hypothetical protein